MNILMDGPLDLVIEGNRVVLRGTSDSERVTVTLTLPDALITRHRFSEAYAAFEAALQGKVITIDFRGQPLDHADTA